MNAAMPFLLSLVCLPGCAGREGRPVVRETVAMNTYVTISVYDAVGGPEAAGVLIDSAVAAIRQVEAMASDYSDSSDIGRVNAAAGERAVAVPHALARLIGRALEFGVEWGGAFNIAVGPLVKRWDFLSEHPGVPPKQMIDSLLQLVDLSAMEVHDDSVRLGKRGMALDLGGIAKGYAVDRAADILRKGGVRHAIVDIGGNLAVIWDSTRGTRSGTVTVEIRHPRKEGAMFGRFTTGSAGVSTSGDYQRCFILDGVRYHHILDPATGYPARGVVAVTVIAPDAMTADVFSTLAFVLGREKGMEFLRTTPGVEGLMVMEEGDTLLWTATDGLKSTFVREQDRD